MSFQSTVPRISFEDASALPSSALSAMLLCEKYLRPNDRVLVLNGSGALEAGFRGGGCLSWLGGS